MEDATARGGGSIDIELQGESSVGLVADDVAQDSEFGHAGSKPWRPVVEQFEIGRGERVLKLRGGGACADVELLLLLQNHLHADELGQLRLQALDDGERGQAVALVEAFEHDEEAGDIWCWGIRVEAEEGTQVSNRGIPCRDEVLNGLSLGSELVEGDVLARTNLALNAAGVLLREEALWNADVEKDSEGTGGERSHEHERLVAQHATDAGSIGVFETLQDAFA